MDICSTREDVCTFPPLILTLETDPADLNIALLLIQHAIQEGRIKGDQLGRLQQSALKILQLSLSE